MVGVGRVEHSLTEAAAVGDGAVAQVLRFNVVLQRRQSGAGLVKSAHLALVLALPLFLYPLPDEGSHIFCKAENKMHLNKYFVTIHSSLYAV
jgi:hypothetical protein